MRAFVLPNNLVQIGDTVYNLTSGETTHSRAMRTGLAKEALKIVYVPGKNLEFAKLAGEQAPRRKGRV